MILGHDKSYAAVGAAAADMVLITIEIITVIISELFAFANIPQGHDPDAAAGDLSLTIRVTGMVDITGGVVGDVAVDVVTAV